MHLVRGLLLITVFAGSANAQSQAKTRVLSGLSRHQPALYVIAAGPASNKFNQQINLLSIHVDVTLALHLVIVPVTSSSLAMGWPTGLSVAMPDQRVRDAVRKHFGEVGGGQEFLVALVDEHGRKQLFSHDPVTIEQIGLALKH
jgi:hypothetical protein